MKCPGCGAEVETRFCTYCGRELQRENVHNIAGDNSTQTIINNYYYSDNNQNQNTQTNKNDSIFGNLNDTSDSTAKSNANASTGTNTSKNTSTSSNNKLIAFILCFMFGGLGVHYFFVGRVGMGLLYLFTGGLCGIGWFIDLIRIATGSFPGLDK